MEQRAYYTFDPKTADRCITNKPLIVNCTGIVSLKQDFHNKCEKGRRDFYLIYLINGEMDLYHGDKRDQFHSGQFVILPPNTYYEYQNLNHSHVDYYWVHFTGNSADNILRTFHRLFDEFLQPDDLFELSCSAHLTTLCTRFSRAVKGAFSPNSKSRLLAKSLQHMMLHYNESLTIPELADRANMSCGYFRLLFREVTGITPSEYITRLRLKNACMLLYQTNIPIGEIAAQVGYADQLYFSRIFRKNYGVSPSEYRNKEFD